MDNVLANETNTNLVRYDDKGKMIVLPHAGQSYVEYIAGPDIIGDFSF